jgi:hypothetical protein
MSLDEIWVQFERPFIFVLGSHRIPVPAESRQREGIGGSRSVIELDSLLGHCQGSRVGLLRRHDAEFAQQVIAVGQADISLRVCGSKICNQFAIT